MNQVLLSGLECHTQRIFKMGLPNVLVGRNYRYYKLRSIFFSEMQYLPEFGKGG